MATCAELKLERLCASFSDIMSGKGMARIVMGLSGGIDSAVAAGIAAKVLGSENVFVYCLPHKDSSIESLEDAKAVASALGLALSVIDITQVVESMCSALCVSEQLRKGNIMSRIRMAALFDISQKLGAIVVGTTNKTEYLLGYGTWHGDMACSVNMLGSLYKREVYELAQVLDIPEKVITKAPSADLWDGQTDEDDFGFSYDIADRFFHSVLELGMTPKEAHAEFSRETVSNIASRVIRSSFKRTLPVTCGDVLCTERYEEIFNKFIALSQ